MVRLRGSAMRRIVCCVSTLVLLNLVLPTHLTPVDAQNLTFNTPVELFGQANDNAGAPTVTEGRFSIFSAASAKVGGAAAGQVSYVPEPKLMPTGR
jgi:hypothetical protein